MPVLSRRHAHLRKGPSIRRILISFPRFTLSLIVGLVLEALCLLGRGPISFLIFSGLGGGLFLAGIGYYLLALV
jgi:hypothetical protein